MSDPIVYVRAATAADAALLSELGARTFRDTFGPDNSPADMDAYLASAFGPKLQAAELDEEHSVFLIAEAEGAPAGYSRLRFGLAPDCIECERPVEIVRLYADRPWLGRGVGAALMRAALDTACVQDCDAVWLDVWERNVRAIDFYRRWGFEVAGTQHFVLGDDVQNDLLMVRSTSVR